MNWTPFLTDEIESAYTTTERLLAKVDPKTLDWKPKTGGNWMTVGQLLKHLTEACGVGCKAFVIGDWGLPNGVNMADLPPEQMLPPAEKLPSIDSVEKARDLLAKDKALALRALSEVDEDRLQNQKLAAPWEPGVERTLGRHFHQMIQHLERHKSQLFYYLKLQGVPVNTGDLWG